MSRYPAHSALRHGEKSLSLEINLPSCFLCVGGIQDFIPKRLRRVVAVLPLHHQAFEVAFLNQFKELQRVTVDMTENPMQDDLRGMIERRIFFRSRNDSSRRSHRRAREYRRRSKRPCNSASIRGSNYNTTQCGWKQSRHKLPNNSRHSTCEDTRG
jgi:hypothetical protein